MAEWMDVIETSHNLILVQEALESFAFPDEFMRKLKIKNIDIFPALSDRAFFVK